MQTIIQPSIINGMLAAPASKSSMQRACAAALLHKGITIISNYGTSNDDNAALNIIENLGATITKQADKIIIESSSIYPKTNIINCGESGLSMRMFASIAALSNQQITLDAEGSLQHRNMNFFDEILPQLNVSINSLKGFPPLNLQGMLIPKNIEIDGSISSQYLTGLLFAFSSSTNHSNNTVSIKVNNLSSKPYIDLTLDVIQKFGMLVPKNYEYNLFEFDYSQQQRLLYSQPKNIEYVVEGDWSNAAFLLVAASISGNIAIQNLDINSTQSDKKIMEVLQSCGANISINQNNISVSKNNLNAFEFDATDCPDLFPPLVALACVCNGKSIIKGTQRLIHKESNRAKTLQQEFQKFGINILLQNDEMIIEGKQQLNACVVNSHNDHRIAMACAIAALKANGFVVIQQSEAINKSYPNFFKHLQTLGVSTIEEK